MPRSGPPTYLYSLPAIYLAIPGTTITAQQHNDPLEDIADTFNSVQPIVWGGTGASSVEGAKAELGFVYQSWLSFTTAAGTADALTLAPDDALLALVTGVPMTLTAAASNTGAATLSVSGLGVKAIRKIGALATEVALVSGDLLAGGKYILVYDSAANSAAGAWMLVNPADQVQTSWTPTITFGGASTGITYGTNNGTAVRDGQGTAYLSFNIILTSKGSATGNAAIASIPFTITQGAGVAPKACSNFTGLTGSLVLDPQTSGTTALIRQTSASGSSAITDANFTNTTTLTGMLIVRIV